MNNNDKKFVTIRIKLSEFKDPIAKPPNSMKIFLHIYKPKQKLDPNFKKHNYLEVHKLYDHL